jgi:hypothetical protein
MLLPLTDLDLFLKFNYILLLFALYKLDGFITGQEEMSSKHEHRQHNEYSHQPSFDQRQC